MERSAVAPYRGKGFYLFQGFNELWSTTILPVELRVSEQTWISIFQGNSGFRADLDLHLISSWLYVGPSAVLPRSWAEQG